MIDALRRASAQRITAVIPYYGYSRQERKSTPRTPITAKLIADLLVSAGVNRILTIELHTGAIQGFFNLPVDHLYSKPVFVEHFAKMKLDNPIIVSPDAGGVERARAVAKVLGCGLAIVDKRRDRPGDSQVMNLIGDVRDKTAILFDDICDTAGSLTSAAAVLRENGALKVYAAATHGVLSGPAINRLNDSCIEKLFITDTIPLTDEAAKCTKIEVLSVSELLGKAIRRIHNSDSISNLFI
jgi:ribose-phosphate pyrophosphokinase